MNRRARALAPVVLWLSITPLGEAFSGDPVAVVVSSRWSELKRISTPELRRLYLGKRTRLGSVSVVCVDLPSGGAEREAFSRAILGKSELEMHDHWTEQALTGGELPPREMKSAGDVLGLVRSQVGAIGYLRWSVLRREAPGGVRVIEIVNAERVWTPADEGYPIQTQESID